MHLLKHLASQFPGLPLEPPLFYNWPIALRFELSTEDPHLTYDEVVQLRATTLYESAFAPTDLTYILGIYEGHTGRRRNNLNRPRPTPPKTRAPKLDKPHLGTPPGKPHPRNCS